VANETKLAVILHADIVSSTELVQRDERLAHDRIQDAFRRFSGTISENAGTIHEVRGDAMVVEFERGSDAANAALAFQAENQRHNAALAGEIRPELRIGIALGEVIIADNTVTGAGVVLAQRIEQLAQPGQVCVSSAIREALPGSSQLHFDNLGERDLKGFDEARRVYAVRRDVGNALEHQRQSYVPRTQRTERPSIAVLPFDNMTSDLEQEHFADGMVEDIITALSKFRELLVIARNSTFTFKGKAVNIAEAAQQLGVRYVVEGSVRKAGERIRVTTQLIDARDASHIWAERYDRKLDDIFDVQDDVTTAIVGAIAPEIHSIEQGRARQKPGNLDAWSEYQLGLSMMGGWFREGFAQAADHLSRAIKLDPDFAPARIAWAGNQLRAILAGFSSERSKSLEEAYGEVSKGLEMSGDDANGRATLALYHGLAGNGDEAEREARQAIKLNPNLPWAHTALGWVLYYVNGDAEGALQHWESVRRLSPRDRVNWRLDYISGGAYRSLGQFEESVRFCRKACEAHGHSSYMPHMHLAATLALMGKTAEAKEHLAIAQYKEPELSIGFVEDAFTGQHSRIKAPLLEGLRAAGLAE
jgi:TolB-like protein